MNDAELLSLKRTMTYQDLLITPIYLAIFYFLAYVIRPSVTTPETKKYFIPALSAKFFGAIMVGVVYQYYYNWGDTYSYFRDGRIIASYLLESPIAVARILFSNPENVADLSQYTSILWYFGAESEYNTTRIVAFCNLFTFNTYSASALVFALFAFSGNWAMYRILQSRYHWVGRNLALFTLFIPSVVFWGSGIFKDTITYGALLWLFYSAFNIIEKQKLSAVNVIIFLINFTLIFSIKKYVVLCFLPAMAIWLLHKFSGSIKNIVLKLLTLPVMIIIIVPSAYFAVDFAFKDDRRYALDNLARTAQVTAYDIRYWTGKEAGSGYTLGELDGTWGSMIRLGPEAINVSLFRPYLWEVSNPLMLLSALESLIFTILFIGLIVRKSKPLTMSLRDPTLLFMLIISVVFAFAVGVSTYNFGTLVRYKIPLMPFFGAWLVILLNPQTRQMLRAQHTVN
ncbi:MAG: hypothetical protein RIC80_16970 [Cyclobacteriaceae bacterium]